MTPTGFNIREGSAMIAERAVRTGRLDPIGYTYDAAEHCPACTAARFGVTDEGWIPESATDSEDNGIGALAPWDEFEQDANCDDCGTLIAEGFELTCPECGEEVWDLPHGHKLAKCWNADGHENRGTLAFDSMD